MHDLLEHMITVFLGFFAIMNPIANTAVFIGLTGDKVKAERNQIARKSLFISFVVILAFSLLGKGIFHLFGITLPALRITGGILIFLVGYHMLQGSGSSMHSSKNESDVDMAISPLAVPLLAGPGTIATAMNYSAGAGWMDAIVTIAMFALLCLITFISFTYSEKITRFFGKSGLSIITRLMGLILAVIGTEMLISGVFGVIDSYPS